MTGGVLGEQMVDDPARRRPTDAAPAERLGVAQIEQRGTLPDVVEVVQCDQPDPLAVRNDSEPVE